MPTTTQATQPLSDFMGDHLSIRMFGAAVDGTTDDTAAIQAAMDSALTRAVPVSILIPGLCRIAGTLSWAANGCRLYGSAEWGSELRHDPASLNTDLLTFPGTASYNTWNSVIGIKLTTVSSTNTRNLLLVENNSKFFLHRCRLSGAAGTSGKPRHHATLLGMLGSLILDNEFVGPNIGTNDSLVVGTSGLGVSTTVSIRHNTFVNCTGAAINLQGGSSGASMLVADNIIESNLYGIKISTSATIQNNHFESNSVSDILYAGNSILYVDGNSFQHSTSTPVIDMTGGGFMYWATNVHFLVAGQTLAYVPTGARWHLTGGALLAWPTFPDPIINSGDISAMSPGAVEHLSFALTGVAGDYRHQLFRGNRSVLEVTGVTALHVIGGNVGGATPIGIPAGEKIYFEITNTSGSEVSTSSATAGDFNILGQINGEGLAAGTQQTVELTADSGGNLRVTSSPGWTSMGSGSGRPGLGESGTWTASLEFGGASTGIVYGSRYADYYRVGNLVVVTLNFSLSSKGSASGIATISGLPFASGALGGAGGLVVYNAGMVAVTSIPTTSVGPGATSMSLQQQALSGGGVGALDDTNFSNTSQIVFTMTYHT